MTDVEHGDVGLHGGDALQRLGGRAGLAHQLLDRQCAQGRQTQALALFLGDPGQPLQLLLEGAGQGNEAAVGQRHEPALGCAQAPQQVLREAPAHALRQNRDRSANVDAGLEARLGLAVSVDTAIAGADADDAVALPHLDDSELRRELEIAAVVDGNRARHVPAAPELDE